MSGERVFAAFGLLTWASGLLAVTSRQVVHAALWLVVALGSLAGVYLSLGAEVVAMVQLLVYVGAVVVLVLFVLMLTRAPIGVHRDLDAPRPQRLAAAGAGIAVAGLIGDSLYAAVQDVSIAAGPGPRVGAPARPGDLRRLAAAVRAVVGPAARRAGGGAGRLAWG